VRSAIEDPAKAGDFTNPRYRLPLPLSPRQYPPGNQWDTFSLQENRIAQEIRKEPMLDWPTNANSIWHEPQSSNQRTFSQARQQD
jgi:hypothetical protein